MLQGINDNFVRNINNRPDLPMSSEGSAQVKVKWKVLGVKVEFVFLQPHSGLDVDKEQPEEYCW